MLEILSTHQFKKDYKNIKKSGYDIFKLHELISLLVNRIS
jgi:mRNA-degrading endonuclease YafQ of YafQ-DinJ toxin-antitoxin module